MQVARTTTIKANRTIENPLRTHKFSKAATNWQISDQEAYVVCHGVHKCRNLVRGKEFVLETEYLDRQTKWSMALCSDVLVLGRLLHFNEQQREQLVCRGMEYDKDSFRKLSMCHWFNHNCDCLRGISSISDKLLALLFIEVVYPLQGIG